MPDDPWTIGRLLAWTIQHLGKHGAENPRLDAEVLLAHARGCKRIDLYAAYGEEATDDVRAAFRESVRRRAQGTPVAYLVGHKEFYSLDFEVTLDVLIPRPETELLVVALLDQVKKQAARDWRLRAGDWGPETGEPASAGGQRAGASPPPAEEPSTPYPVPPPTPTTPSQHPTTQHPTSNIQHLASNIQRIADVGTGSGILAICAAKYLPHARVTAIDVSPAALAVARRNAERHAVADRITFLESNLFAAVPPDARFDFILSNPPYVSTAEMANLPPDVGDHEPHVALEAGEKGTAVIEPLIAQAAERLKPGGMLILEVSPMIAAAGEDLIHSSGSFTLAPTLRDTAGHARVIQATRR